MSSREVSSTGRPSLEDQIAALNRELIFRERIYPKWVITRHNGMTEGKAKHEIECIREALYTLRKVKLTASINNGFDH